MSLRTKILLLFAFLAVAPIVAIGFLGYTQSMQALESLLQDRVQALASQDAQAIRRHYEILDTHLGILGRTAHRLGDAKLEAAARAADRATPQEELEEQVEELRSTFASLEISRPDGEVLYRFTQPSPRTKPVWLRCVQLESPNVVRKVVREPRSGRELVVSAELRAGGALPFSELSQGLGNAGYSIIVDRETDRVVYSSECAYTGRQWSTLTAGWSKPIGGNKGPPRFRFKEGGRSRVASIAEINGPTWAVVTTATVGEFGAAFAHFRLFFLTYTLAIALTTAAAFWILSRSVMRSLGQLAEAADRFGDGQFATWLPPPTGDEVGRLSMAFSVMARNIREMMRQVESDQQFAVVGRLAAFVAHEIRNPLSAIRIYLQGVHQEVRQGSVPDDLLEVTDTCLQEIKRLDGVVTNVLALARAKPVPRAEISIHELLEATLHLLRPEFEHRRVEIILDLQNEPDVILGDEQQLKGTIINLLLNAAEAMPLGGKIEIGTRIRPLPDGRPGVAIRIADTGHGVAPELRDRIFQPFFTTKASGSGLGLPVALRTVQAHGGILVFEKESELVPGAEFVMQLPLKEAQNSPNSAGDGLVPSGVMGLWDAASLDSGRRSTTGRIA